VADFYAQNAADENRPEAERQRFATEARKTYRRALQQDPKYLPAYIGLGRLAESLGERDEAVAIYNEALTHHSKDASVWFERGVSLSRMKRYEDALASYQRASQIEPKNKTYNISAGYMYAILGRQEESLTCFRRVLPEASSRYSLALVLRRLGMEDDGRKQLALALRAEPNHRPSLDLLAHWNEPNFRGGDDGVHVARHTTTESPTPDTASPLNSANPPRAVVISKPSEISLPVEDPASVKPTANAAGPSGDVRWNKTEAPSGAVGMDQTKPAMPLIPVLSEHWEQKPSAPSRLHGLPPVKMESAKPKPVAKLGFEEQP
jgi:tetratricopeptide (TPR) repeat protein